MALLGAQFVNAVSPNPVGSLQAYAGASAPTGWLLCDGGQTLITAYPELYSVLGTTYGALTNGSGSAGSTHFRVPDLRGRVPMGAGTGLGLNTSGTGATSGTAMTNRTRGEWGGEETHLNTSSESGVPAHSHPPAFGSQFFVNPGGGAVIGSGTFLPANLANNTTTGNNTAANAANRHNNVQPFLVTNYIIKAVPDAPRSGLAYGSTPPIVTALPANPQFGDVVTYIADAANGVAWNLQYDASGTYPWKFIGGSGISRGDTGSTQETTTSTSYATTTSAPALTVPLAGDYEIAYDLEMGYIAGGPGVANSYATVKLGAAAASDDNAVVMWQSQSSVYVHVGRTVRRTLAASNEVKQFYKAPAGTTLGVLRRSLIVTPVRVSA